MLEARLKIGRLQVRIPAGVAGEFSSLSQLCVLTLIQCPFNHRVTAVAPKRPRSFCHKRRWQVPTKDAYTFDPTKLEWADYAAVPA